MIYHIVNKKVDESLLFLMKKKEISLSWRIYKVEEVNIMKEIEQYTEKIFEEIKHIDEEGNEYWEARELMTILDYSKWENFYKVISQAKITC